MTAKLHLGKDLFVPPDAITQTWGFLGRKGSGKTYAAGVLVETLLGGGGQVVVLDPIGNWFGLRLSKTGRSPSEFKIPILGGERGDVPLEPAGGTLVADFLVESGSSAVLDVSPFRKGQRKEFVAAFAEQLFHRKKTRRSPMLLVLEEAQVFAPQRADRGEERMLGAVEDIVRLGRNYGIGAALISQRPQSVNKEVLNQVEPLVVFQLVAKHERDAVRGWTEHAGAEVGRLLDELPALQTGECFFWSPAWLRTFAKTRFLPKLTFDASATPTFGVALPDPVALKPVDLDALRASMKEAIERKEAEDPKKLRASVEQLRKEKAWLERQLAERKPEPDQAATQRVVEKAVAAAIADRDRHWKAEAAKLTKAAAELQGRIRKATAALGVAGEDLPALPSIEAPPAANGRARELAAAARNITPPRPAAGHSARNIPSAEPAEGISRPQQKLLDALAWLESAGLPEPKRTHVAAIAGVSPRSSGFEKNVSTLSTKGLIRYPGPGLLALSDEGRSVASAPDAPGTLDELHAAWLASPALSGPQRELLRILLREYPEPLSREALADEAGVSAKSSGFEKNVSTLSSLGLAEYPEKGFVAAGDLLFPADVP